MPFALPPTLSPYRCLLFHAPPHNLLAVLHVAVPLRMHLSCSGTCTRTTFFASRNCSICHRKIQVNKKDNRCGCKLAVSVFRLVDSIAQHLFGLHNSTTLITRVRVRIFLPRDKGVGCKAHLVLLPVTEVLRWVEGLPRGKSLPQVGSVCSVQSCGPVCVRSCGEKIDRAAFLNIMRGVGVGNKLCYTHAGRLASVNRVQLLQ